MKPVICLDFDGVINSYESGYGPHYKPTLIPDGPTEGAKEAIAKLRKRFRVIVHSSRCVYPEAREAIRLWLDEYGIIVDGIAENKPPAMIYLDDRGVQFKGDWGQALKDIANFQHWFMDDAEWTCIDSRYFEENIE
jgi:hypothetical protein